MVTFYKIVSIECLNFRSFVSQSLRILTVVSASAILLSCGDNNSANKYLPVDSLGNKVTDSTHRGDTMYYERLQQKTGSEDSSSGNSRRSDTAYYERLPQRTNPRDSSH